MICHKTKDSALLELRVSEMTAWRNENNGCFSAVKRDDRDQGGHLDVSQRGLAGTLSERFQEATFHVISVGASPRGSN